MQLELRSKHAVFGGPSLVWLGVFLKEGAQQARGGCLLPRPASPGLISAPHTPPYFLPDLRVEELGWGKEHVSPLEHAEGAPKKTPPCGSGSGGGSV